MMRIRLNSFAGMFPKVHPSRLQETASTQMHDMLLENGVLTPVTVPATAQTWQKSIYRWTAFRVASLIKGNNHRQRFQTVRQDVFCSVVTLDHGVLAIIHSLSIALCCQLVVS